MKKAAHSTYDQEGTWPVLGSLPRIHMPLLLMKPAEMMKWTHAEYHITQVAAHTASA